MFDAPSEVWSALSSSTVVRRLWGIAQYQDRSAVLTLDGSGDVTFAAGTGVLGDATITAYGNGDSLVPKTRRDLLAPYGQEVSLFWDVILRDGLVHTIPVGVFRIVGNDGGREVIERRVVTSSSGSGVDANGLLDISGTAVSGLVDVPETPDGNGLVDLTGTGGTVTVIAEPSGVGSWAVTVDLADRIRMLERGKRVDVKSPTTLSMYSEMQQLALFPMVQTVPDVSVPKSLAYDDRLSAMQDLADLGGGVLGITRQGALTIRERDRWLTETVPDFDIEAVIDFSRGQSDDFINDVHTYSPDGKYSAFAQITDPSNELSIDNAGPVTYEHSSPAYTSNVACQAGADTILARLSRRRTAVVEAQIDPRGILLDLGDFGWLRDPVQGRAALGEVSRITIPNDPTGAVRVQLIVAEEA